MPTPLYKIVAEIDELMEAANPPDGSAPLGPIIQIGNLINRVWPTLRRELSNDLEQKPAT